MQAAVAKSVYLGLYHSVSRMSQTHQLMLPSRLAKIVEVETLRLPFLIVGDHQISHRLGIRRAVGIAELFALRFALLFLGSLVQSCPFFLPLREGGARVSCHKNVVRAFGLIPLAKESIQ